MQIIEKRTAITLVSLVITVIILIILAGVGIGALGPDGLIEKAKQSKEEAQIDEEREIVATSVIQSAGANRYGNIEKTELGMYLQKNAPNRETEVIEDTQELYAYFKDTNRYYKIEDDGNISNPITKGKDEFAGDITKGGKYDGKTEIEAYQITCIEDLVAFSIMTNGGNAELGLKSSTFTDEYVTLKSTLNFNSMFSYNDPTSTKYGDLNADGTVEDIKTELTKTSENCIGFTPIKNFNGYFNGQENEIQNIYVNREDDVAFFVTAAFAGGPKAIKNIGITGQMTSSNGSAAGIAVGVALNKELTIENCWNKADIIGGKNWVAGICYASEATIKNCYNTGNITGMTNVSTVGGITAEANNSTIENCYNTGNITNNGTWYIGGIVRERKCFNNNNKKLL